MNVFCHDFQRKCSSSFLKIVMFLQEICIKSWHFPGKGLKWCEEEDYFMFKKDCKKEFKEAKVAKSLNVKCVTGTQEVVKLQLPNVKAWF